MSETFAQYIEKWLKQSTVQGLTNPLVKMPVKRFRLLQPDELKTVANGGTLLIGTTSDPIARNLHRNYQSRIRERGEHCAFICYGSIEIVIAAAADQPPRAALFPICLKRASLEQPGDKVRVTVSDELPWQINPVLQANLKAVGLTVSDHDAGTPEKLIPWLKAQLGNRASSVRAEAYIGLFSSQQMVLQQRLSEPSVRQALAQNKVIQAKLAGTKVAGVDLGPMSDDGIEQLGLILPCDDHQLRVIQLAAKGLAFR